MNKTIKIKITKFPPHASRGEYCITEIAGAVDVYISSAVKCEVGSYIDKGHVEYLCDHKSYDVVVKSS